MPKGNLNKKGLIILIKSKIKISVRNIIEFVLKAGSIDSTYIGGKRAQEGTRIHQLVQKKRKKEALLNDNVYESEFSLKYNLEYKEFEFQIEGRADGVLITNDFMAIEEIKSTYKKLDTIVFDKNHWHIAQAKIYAFMYSEMYNTPRMKVILSYCNVESEEIITFSEYFSKEELKSFFLYILEKYYVFADFDYERIRIRNITAKNLEFPYKSYRKSQREMAVCVYKTIKLSKKLFVQAPTGTGKTISTIFPAIKALEQGLAEKIFYLTAKTITRQVAEEAFLLMKNKGLVMRVVTLTAKDKICFNNDKKCDPLECIYANGHFDRVNEALLDILQEDIITRSVIEKYSKLHNVCPFEFSFDITNFCDCIICDYNYVYDPKVYLKRYFSEGMKNEFIILTDESHNLVERSREMYSANISKIEFSEVKKELKAVSGKIFKSLGKINKCIISIADNQMLGEKSYTSKEDSKDLYFLLHDFIRNADIWLQQNQMHKSFTKVIELYFKVLDYLRISEFFDTRYIFYVEANPKDVLIKLLCLDSSYMLSNISKRVKSSVFFSATLTPLTYFKSVLGGVDEDFSFTLQSPFDQKNLCVVVDSSISTKYLNRENSYEQIADRLVTMINSKVGNYFVFFSSYLYLENVLTIFKEKNPNNKILVQEKNLNEEDRELFLNEFVENPKESMLAFSVLGGIFSEGIDLTGERLSGVMVVGVGLPMITTERNIISDYHKEKSGSGFEFAYQYPGMNKVLQAAGRVIRTETDKGIVILIDNRFLQTYYKKLFPLEWEQFFIINSSEKLQKRLAEFWG